MAGTDLLTDKQAYIEVLGTLKQSGYSIEYMVYILLYLQKQEKKTKHLCSLLARGYNPIEAEYLIQEGKWHHLAFNRTIVELKHRRKRNHHDPPALLLIEPLWN